MIVGHFLGLQTPGPESQHIFLDVMVQKNATFDAGSPQVSTDHHVLVVAYPFPFWAICSAMSLLLGHSSDVSRLLSRENRRRKRFEAELRVDVELEIVKPLAGETIECLGAAPKLVGAMLNEPLMSFSRWLVD